ncbi:MAG TPA: HD domain-containing protein [Coriobacteriaceae bacterium]|nr:HD domain-containing protein [Coriobacteriaceae bacterium]
MGSHDSTSLGIDDNRLIHSREVGRLAARLASDVFGWNKTRCQQMFLLGLVHDCGYGFVDDPLDHPIAGSAVLKEAGYSYWREVRWHGMPCAPYYSDELLVLNIADMLVSKGGERIPLSQRLDDIGRRYGLDSEQLVQAKRLACEIDCSLKLRRIDLGELQKLWDFRDACI